MNKLLPLIFGLFTVFTAIARVNEPAMHSTKNLNSLSFHTRAVQQAQWADYGTGKELFSEPNFPSPTVLAAVNFTASYPFTNVSTTSGTTDPTPVPVVSGVTFSTFTAVGTPTNPNASGRFSFTDWALGAINASNTFTGTANTAEYYQVTVTPAAGGTYSLSSIDFKIQRSGTGIRQYSVRSSSDGFASNLPASISPAASSLQVVTPNVFQIDDANTSATAGSKITLNGSFANLTGPVTFRFYGFNAEGTGGTFSIDDVNITGISGTGSADTDPPLNLAGFPKTQNITPASADLLSSLNEAGTTYYVLIPATGNAPTTSAQVKAGQDGNSVAAFKSGSFAVAANSSATSSISGLASNTGYKVFVVSQDAASTPNLQTSFTSLSFTTTIPAPVVTPVIISQYYEGSSVNKWIELTNLSGSPVNTASPQLRLGLYNISGDSGTMNITGTPGQSVNLNVTIPAYGTVLIGNTGNGTEVPYLSAASAAQSSNAVINFNGNDAVALLDANNNVLDAFGQGLNAKDDSYVRKSTVSGPSPSFISSDWTLTNIQVVQNAEDLDDPNRLGVHLVPNLPACVSPVAQPTALAFSGVGTKTITLNFSPAAGAGEYLIVRSLNNSLSASPTDGTVYNAGTSLGGGTVAGRIVGNTFTDSNLPSGTSFYYFIYAVNSISCNGGPKYLTVNPLSGSQATNPLPACASPVSQASNFNVSYSNYNLIQGSFVPAAGADEFVIVMSKASTLSSLPVNQTNYSIGDSIGGGVVIKKGAQSTFSRSGLAQDTEYHFYIFAVNSNCSGGPLYLTAAPLTGMQRTSVFNATALNYYFGNLHAHSSYSDGNKDDTSKKPEDDYAFAKNSMKMDFLGLSEHNHTQAGMRLANWQPGIIAAQNATTPDFVAMHGMEWGVISGGGHVIVYGVDSLIGWEPGEHQIYVPKSTYTGTTGLFNAINRHGLNAVATLAHPNTSDFNNVATTYDALADSAIVGTALASGPAFSTNVTYSDPGSSMSYLSYYHRMLARGYHLGASIDHDNHNMTFGRHTRARLVVLAPALTENDLLDGMKKMRFYASEDSAAKITYTINNQPVGSIFTGNGMPNISVSGVTTSPITQIMIISGTPGSGITPDTIFTSSTATLNYSDSRLVQLGTGYYYADIKEADGSRIITSPIWYTRNDSLKTQQTITFNPIAGSTYGDPDVVLSATSSNSTIPITFSSSDTNIATIIDGKVHLINAGSVTITAAQAGNNLYKAAVPKIQSLIISAKGISASVQAKQKEYGSPDPELTYTFNPALFAGDSFTGSLIREAGESAGTYAITRGSLILSSNYILSVDTATFIITKKAVLAKADQKTKVYGSTDPTLTYTYAPELVSGDTFTGSLSRVFGNNTGTYAIKQGTLGLSNNYTLAVDSALFTITRKDLAIKADDKTRAYGIANPELTASYNGFISGEDASNLITAPALSTTATQSSSVGTYPITAIGASALNYTISYLPGVFTVTQATQTITFATLAAKTYGDPDFALTATGGASGKPLTYTSSNSSVATISGNTVHIVGAGSTTITVSQQGSANFIAAADVTQNLIVNKANGTLTLTNLTQANDGTEKPVTVTTNPAMLPGVSITYNGSFSAPVAVGTYSVNASLNHINYTALPVSGTLTLTQQQLLKVQYRNADGKPDDGDAKPNFKILNNGASAIAYTQLTARYWITPENFTGSLDMSVDQKQAPKNSMTMRYLSLSSPKIKALGYIEYSFIPVAGSLSGGSNSGEIDSKFANTDKSDFDESNDYSIGTNKSFEDKPTFTLYRNGVLIWGTEPADENPVTRLKVFAETKSSGSSKTISSTIDIRNTGNVALDYKDITARYWFTSDSPGPLIFALEHAKKSDALVTGSFFSINPSLTNADNYVELKVRPANTTFYPLTTTGNIDFRISKSDGSSFNRLNDHSYQAGDFAENSRITLYHKGVLVFGTEPTGLTASSFMSIGIPEKNASVSPLRRESESTIIYPNPSYGNFMLSLGDDRTGSFKATIYDFNGKPVDNYSGNKTGSFSKEYRLQLSKGMYYMIINWKDYTDYKTILIN